MQRGFRGKAVTRVGSRYSSDTESARANSPSPGQKLRGTTSKTAGYDVTFRTFDVGHAVPSEMVAAIIEWLKAH